MSGHADFDQYGQDIVCAGASILATSLINYLLDMKEDLDYHMVPGQIPLVKVDLGANGLVDNILAQGGFRYFDLGALSLEESYGDYVRLEYQEV